MSSLIERYLRVSMGVMRVWDDGSYEITYYRTGRTVSYEPNHGPQDLQIIVRQILIDYRNDPSRAEERAINARQNDHWRRLYERLAEIERSNARLVERLGFDRNPRVQSNPVRHVPNCRTDREIPINGQIVLNTGPIRNGTRRCFFTPIYRFSGSRVRVRFHAVNPPDGEWSVQMFDCARRVFSNDPCYISNPSADQRSLNHGHQGWGIYPNIRGRSISRDIVFDHDPTIWLSRKIYFRIRNGSTVPISNVQITFNPEFPDPLLAALHDALSIAGLTPLFGIIPDGINCLIYISEADWANAGLSGLSMLPGVFGESAAIYQMNELRGYHVIRALRSEIGNIPPEEITSRLNRLGIQGRRVRGGARTQNSRSSRRTAPRNAAAEADRSVSLPASRGQEVIPPSRQLRADNPVHDSTGIIESDVYGPVMNIAVTESLIREIFTPERLRRLLGGFDVVNRYIPQAVQRVYRRTNVGRGLTPADVDVRLGELLAELREIIPVVPGTGRFRRMRSSGEALTPQQQESARRILREARFLARERWNSLRSELWRQLFQIPHVRRLLRMMQQEGLLLLPRNFPNSGSTPSAISGSRDGSIWVRHVAGDDVNAIAEDLGTSVQFVQRSIRAVERRIAQGRTAPMPLQHLSLNIDHITPIQLNPFRFFDGENLRVLPASYNDHFLRLYQTRSGFPMTDDILEEWIRSFDLVRRPQ